MPARVWLLWALFLLRGASYSTFLPLWEGWDEYAHFAWLQHWIDYGTLPHPQDSMSREIDESMQLAPLPHELSWIGPPYLTHEEWWALSPQERDARLKKLRSLRPELAHEPGIYPFVFYEAQQPPLYYWLASAPLRLIHSLPIGRRVWFIRLFGIGIASFVIPLTWLAARLALGKALAIICAALLAIAPGLAIDVARVANDGLSLPLVAALVWLLLRPKQNWLAVGLVIGAGLLTKAYLLALIPAVILCWNFKYWRRLCLALASAVAIGGWWYARNLLYGNSFTGWMNEVSLTGMLAGVPRVNWLAATQVSAKSFLWFGAWSFLTLKSWIYTGLEVIGLVAVIGWFRLQRETVLTGLRVPFAFGLCFGLAMVYSTLGIYATTGVPNAPGWYLWAAACPLAILFVAGMRRAAVVLVAAFALVDLYGVNAVMLPYYAGLVARNHASLGKVPEELARLHVPVLWWIVYAASTVAIPFIAAAVRD